MSNKIENPVVLIHKRENHDSYAVAITNGSHDFYDGLLMASVSPDEADNSFAVFAMVGYYMAAEIEKLRAQRDALAAENVALRSKAAELESLMEPKLPQPAVVDNDKFRADFERWMVEDEKCIVGSSDPYPAGIESRNWRAWNACRAAMLQSQDSGIKDSWISCSERMPVIGELNWRTSFPLLVTCEIGVIPAYYGFVSVNGDRHYGFMESLKYGDANGNHPQTNEYGLISNVTHWMSLPERRRSRTVNNAELFQKISALATECHAIASELDVGDERTEMFEIYSVLRNLCRRGYATQVGRMTNPLLSSCDEDDSDEDDE